MTDLEPIQRGAFLVISGPSGSGKSTAVSEILRRHPETMFEPGCTTRKRRAGEVPDRDLRFLDERDFERAIGNGEFAEWESKFGALYGTRTADLNAARSTGKLCLMIVGIDGAWKLHHNGLPARFVFIEPNGGASALRSRLVDRGDLDSYQIERRVMEAEREMQIANTSHIDGGFIDTIIRAMDIPGAVQQLEHIVAEMLCKELDGGV